MPNKLIDSTVYNIKTSENNILINLDFIHTGLEKTIVFM